MEIARPPFHKQRRHPDRLSLPDQHSDLQSVLEENARLRELVVRLSDIILRQVGADFYSRPSRMDGIAGSE
jgi:hypothetical protein